MTDSGIGSVRSLHRCCIIPHGLSASGLKVLPDGYRSKAVPEVSSIPPEDLSVFGSVFGRRHINLLLQWGLGPSVGSNLGLKEICPFLEEEDP